MITWKLSSSSIAALILRVEPAAVGAVVLVFLILWVAGVVHTVKPLTL